MALGKLSNFSIIQFYYLYNRETTDTHIMVLLCGLNAVHAKHLEQGLSHSKCTTNVSLLPLMMTTDNKFLVANVSTFLTPIDKLPSRMVDQFILPLTCIRVFLNGNT